MSKEDLRNNDMMARLMDALEKHQDIGHYGRLVFTMIGRHFLDDDELVELLKDCPDFDERQARGLVQQVKQRNYNPPRPQKIREWQSQQRFEICPTNDPDGCNVYRNLKFPDRVYENINEYHEEKAHAEQEQQQIFQ